MARKPTKRDLLIEAHVDLLARLDDLALLPPEPCRCGRTDLHYTCVRCNECVPFLPTARTPCEACGSTAKGMAYQELHMRRSFKCWQPAERFAATFSRDLAARIRDGKVPTEKQLALANKLIRQDHTRKPYAWEEPALVFLTMRSPAWRDVAAFVGGKAEETDQIKEQQRVREEAQRIIAKETGFVILGAEEDYFAAMDFAQHDLLFGDVLQALLKLHRWLVRTNQIVDKCPEHLQDLRRAMVRGDQDAALVLADALAAHHVPSSLVESRRATGKP